MHIAASKQVKHGQPRTRATIKLLNLLCGFTRGMVDKLGPPIFVASNGRDGLKINGWQTSVKPYDQIMPRNIQA